ncbi:MAG: hypothetical protein U9Q84_05085 [Thermodesulfobacteriota bacterium]|nr:hypothetical protein [Thermodesulfobacteriota bacterium]
MNYTNKKELINVIDKSAEDLHLKLDMHCHLMTAMLKQNLDDGNIKELFLPSCYRKEASLKEAIKEAIAVLEDSRKAFKSKRLEALRNKLTQVLIDSN